MADKDGSPKGNHRTGVGLVIAVCMVTMVIIPLIAIVGLGALTANGSNIATGLGVTPALRAVEAQPESQGGNR